MREPIRTPSGCIDGSAMIAAGRGAELSMMDISDYADTIGNLSNYAEGLELEATLGNPADTKRLSKAALSLRDAIDWLRPFAESDPDPDDEITAADPAPVLED